MSRIPIERTERGLYCASGDFYVDPWVPVPRAVITHAHADHACWGCGRYLTSTEGRHVLRTRMGADAVIDTLGYGETADLGGARVSLHPAGHILGSSQVRIEVSGYVAVVSGDYKVEPDQTCTPFEPVRCHLFLTESTFGLPIYRWRPEAEVSSQINVWWRANADAGRPSMLFAYALGKSQRLLAGLDPSIGPIVAHGAVEKLNRAYRASGIPLPATTYAGDYPKGADVGRVMVIAPPSAQGTPWSRRFAGAATGLASGWMRIRGTRRRKAVDRGFVLSDHADWPGLLSAIRATEAETVWVTHGYAAVLARWLREQGLRTETLATRWEGEQDSGGAEEEDVIA